MSIDEVKAQLHHSLGVFRCVCVVTASRVALLSKWLLVFAYRIKQLQKVRSRHNKCYQCLI